MLKVSLRALRAIALSASMLMGLSAFAKGPAPAAIDFFSPLKMPRYEQWRKLSPKAREEFIQDVQAFLLRADAMARSGNKAQGSREAQLIQRLFDIWIQTAEAKTRANSKARAHQQQQPYCINQGVVKPLSECDTKLGYKMHNFDTNEKLSALGDASQCQAPEKPCSPFFGFTAEGQMFCSSLNLTRDCAQKSAQPGTITLASTLSACEKGSPGTAKVDCGKLKTFFDEQMSAVDQLCKDAPKRFACGILKDQIQAVMAEKDGASTQAPQAAAADADSRAASDGDEGEVPNLAEYVNDSVKMEGAKAPCPPEQIAKPETTPATSPASAAAAAQSSTNQAETKCVNKPYPQKVNLPVLDALMAAMAAGADKDFLCGQMDLPNQGKMKLDLSKGEVQFKASKSAAPVTVDEEGFKVLLVASNVLANGPFKVSANALLNSYIPKESLKDAGVILFQQPNSQAPKDYPATGWTSADGTRIRYSLDETEKQLLLAIKRPNEPKEYLIPLSLKPSEEQAKAQAQAKLSNQQK
jgi:hypothetical protein